MKDAVSDPLNKEVKITVGNLHELLKLSRLQAKTLGMLEQEQDPDIIQILQRAILSIQNGINGIMLRGIKEDCK
jgi:hypothetical protein